MAECPAIHRHPVEIREARDLLSEIAADLDAQILRQQLVCDQTLNIGVPPKHNGAPYKVNLSARNWRHFSEAIAKLSKIDKARDG